MALNTLSLNALKFATGATNASLNECNGSAGTEVKMSEFTLTSVSIITGTTPIPTTTGTTYYLTFTGAGAKFTSRIASSQNSCTWSATGQFTFSDSTQDYSGTGTSGASAGAATIYGKLTDTYNVNATGYGVNQSKVIAVE